MKLSLKLLSKYAKESTESVSWKCSLKKVFLKIPQNSQENKHLCQSLCFSKGAGLRPATLLKKSLWHTCFPVNLVKFLRSPFFIEHPWWLLLNLKLQNCNSVFLSNLFHFSLLSLKNFDKKFRDWHVSSKMALHFAILQRKFTFLKENN